MIYYDNEHRKRAMKSFAAFMLEFPRQIKDGKYLCRQCDGSGRVIADYERPDPVEGYKMADRVTCPSCGGKKFTTEKDYRDYFKIKQAEYRLEQREQRYRDKVRRQALKKLTKEERNILGVH
jgi:Zn finger protein HypA/HybF involved in hydrogenase expression